MNPRRRAVPTTNASCVALAAILTQPDDSSDWEGHQHPVAYESLKLTAVERNCPGPAHVLEQLAVVYALRV